MRRRSRFVFRQRNLTPGLLRTFQGSDVPFQSTEFRSLYGRFAEYLAIGIFIHLLQTLVIERQELLGGVEFRRGVRTGITVPGTDKLADIATIQVIAHSRNYLGRNLALVLDGLVGYALT